ncbi:uncharacterized protein N7529_004075 [Penicillium soppii]|uniref:uncharacterized protein n=1 Tax=Penicillium soppii TaxID=69789 RepID=UPI00254896D0|nr:uncharacterized protein N7529_004075 [Penicillium soppii]KAJ5871722.1 hypothetical protein N7529_004075 [Penicillium soppii]
MEFGVRERISLVGVVVLICVWYSYKRPFSRKADSIKSEELSTDERHEFENRPPIDILYPDSNTPETDEAEVE